MTFPIYKASHEKQAKTDAKSRLQFRLSFCLLSPSAAVQTTLHFTDPLLIFLYRSALPFSNYAYMQAVTICPCLTMLPPRAHERVFPSPRYPCPLSLFQKPHPTSSFFSPVHEGPWVMLLSPVGPCMHPSLCTQAWSLLRQQRHWVPARHRAGHRSSRPRAERCSWSFPLLLFTVILSAK